jgi:hypothetical protein
VFPSHALTSVSHSVPSQFEYALRDGSSPCYETLVDCLNRLAVGTGAEIDKNVPQHCKEQGCNRSTRVSTNSKNGRGVAAVLNQRYLSVVRCNLAAFQARRQSRNLSAKTSMQLQLLLHAVS